MTDADTIKVLKTELEASKQMQTAYYENKEENKRLKEDAEKRTLEILTAQTNVSNAAQMASKAALATDHL